MNKKKVKKYMKGVSRYVHKKMKRELSHMQECKIKLENEPKMQANMQSCLPTRST